MVTTLFLHPLRLVPIRLMDELAQGVSCPACLHINLTYHSLVIAGSLHAPSLSPIPLSRPTAPFDCSFRTPSHISDTAPMRDLELCIRPLSILPVVLHIPHGWAL